MFRIFDMIFRPYIFCQFFYSYFCLLSKKLSCCLAITYLPYFCSLLLFLCLYLCISVLVRSLCSISLHYFIHPFLSLLSHSHFFMHISHQFQTQNPITKGALLL